MNKRISLLGAAALIAVLATPQATSAQARSAWFAPFGGYNVDAEEVLVGASFGLPIKMGLSALTIAPGFEYYPSTEGMSVYTFLVHMTYGIPMPQAKVQPYIGGGFSLTHASIDVGVGTSVSGTNSQLSAMGGLGFGTGSFRPFVEGDLRFADGSAFILKGGGRILLGR